MYAVVRTGGKQVRVAPGEAVRVEKLGGRRRRRGSSSARCCSSAARATPASASPSSPARGCVGTITAHGRGPKITIFKQKRRKNYRRKQGHRQSYTEVRVESIDG